MNTWTPKNSHILRGIICELEVFSEYYKNGFQIYKHRYKSRYAEIDWIFRKNNLFVLVEVKSLKDGDYAVNRLSRNQKMRLQRAYDDFSRCTDHEVEFHYAIVSQKEGILIFDDFWN